jgi:amidohydrolase
MLSARRDELRGSLKFVFQPAEEGLGGAEAVIADGVLERPRVDRSLALHVWNELLLGKVAIHAGPLMAGGEIFNARLEGRGGHGALPHQAVDPVLAAAQVTLALQSIVSRNVSPLQAAVVSVTRIQAGEAFNVIPPAAELTGTIRTFEAETRELVLRRFGEIVRGVGEAMGCRVTLDIRPVTPAVINDAGSAQALQEMARRDFPELQIDTQFRTMVSEDMAYLLERAPGVYFLVGAANPEKGLVYGHHHPKFDFDEDALIHAAALMAAAALELQHKDIDGK